MCKFITALVMLLCVYGACLAQSAGSGSTSATETIKWEEDSVWIINTGYDIYTPLYHLTLDLPAIAGATHYTIDKGDGVESVKQALPGTTLCTYNKAGVYEMRIRLYDSETASSPVKVIYRFVMNQGLSADFKLEPLPFKYCLEWGGDSLLLVLENFNNPTGTVYDIVFDSKASGVSGLADSLAKYTWYGEKKDSAWIEFLQPTGTYDCKISIKMTYRNEEKNIDMEAETDARKVSVYKAPDMKEIFRFSDTLSNGEELKNFEVCTNLGQSYMQMNSSVLLLYQYKPENISAYPYYTTLNKRKNFTIEYYYTEDPGTDQWDRVTGNLDYVDTTNNIAFRKGGFYKVMVTAFNKCNYHPETGEFKADTLWSHHVKGTTQKRYFQVSESFADKIFCLNDTLCFNKENKIVLVDRNVRKKYDAPPQYVIQLKEKDSTDYYPDEYYTVSQKIYKDGAEIEGDIAEAGCDSTVLEVYVKKFRPGWTEVELVRTSVCGGINRSFPVHFGREPLAVNPDTISIDLVAIHGFEWQQGVLQKCDSFRYQLHDTIWNMNSFERDSLIFYFDNGGKKDTVVYSHHPQEYYDFDRTGVTPSYIKVKTSNYCGWSQEIETGLLTHIRPEADLLRDSVAENDSLCIGFEYPYYWGGTLPEDYEVVLQTDKKVWIDGVAYDAGTSATIGDWQVKAPQVQYEEGGKIAQKFWIKNKAMPGCMQVLDTFVYMISAPDTLLYKDSIRYCETLNTLTTSELFKAGEDNFKWGDWKWNEQSSVREKFPDFTYRGTGLVDTLRYRLSNSKGCYVQGEVMMRPEKAPELELASSYQMCLPDTIKVFREAAYVQKVSAWEGKYALRVYYDDLSRYNSLYNESNGTVTHFPYVPESTIKRLIYVQENLHVDTAFMGKCRVTDSVSLDISTPRLSVTKDGTLEYDWKSYDFAELKTISAIDTAEIKSAPVSWKSLPANAEVAATVGTPGTGLYDRTYVLSEAEKVKDSLLFELSVESLCGRPLKDTLVVNVVHPKLQGYKDTICSNTENFALWDQVTVANLDESSLQWEMCYPADPAHNGLNIDGVNTTYTAVAGVDSVRIFVKGGMVGFPNITTGDTIILLVNPAPAFKFLKDTLFACGRQVKLPDISSLYIDSAHCAALEKGDVVLAPGKDAIGRWEGDDYTFADLDPANFNVIAQKVSYKAVGLPGCKAVLDTVTLFDPAYARITFKREVEEMCAAQQLKLDTIYHMSGGDPYTRLRWKLTTSDMGHFDSDTSHYVASEPEDKVQKIEVVTYKSYQCYSGNPSGEVLQTEAVVLPVIVHREPIFQVTHKYDTLCRAENEIHIARNWVEVSPSTYPDYRDSLKINGQPLRNAGLNYTIGQEGERDTLVVSVSQGMCRDWENIRDTIYLFRLPYMVEHLFTLPEVCSGGQITLPEVGAWISSLAKRYSWDAAGGSITGNVFRPDEGAVSATVSLKVTPPRDGCDIDEYKLPVVVYGRPEMDLRPDTICKLEGQTLSVVPSVSGENLRISQVEWYRSGEEGIILKQSPQPQAWDFTLTVSDIAKGKVELVERVTLTGACAGMYYDTLKIALQEQPEVHIPVDLSVCQGSSTDILTEISTGFAGGVSLTLENTTPGVLNGSIYTPSETFFGIADFKIKAAGLHGCPDAGQDFQVKVKAAPQPSIEVEGLLCEKDTLTLKAQLPGGMGAVCNWKMGDSRELTGTEVKYVYDAADDYPVTLEVSYSTACKRQVVKNLSVHPKPQALFDVPDQVGLDKVVGFVSNSLPADVNSSWKMSDGGSYNGNTCSHIFTGNMGMRQVELKVETAAGCWDTLSHTLLAVSRPVPKFEVDVDSCTGRVDILNQSDSNYAQVIEWDFANGTSLSDAWDPVTQIYKRVYQDTVYKISLTLKNAAGEATHIVPVKMISRLIAGVDVLTPSEPCNKLEKEIQILTRGHADTTRIWWGDGSYQQWSGIEIQTLRHRYENDTTIALYFPLVMAVENVCEKDTTDPVSVRVYPVGVKARIALDTNYKNECYGYERGFINKSFGFMAEGYTAEWQFEKDITTNTDISVEHVFDSPGTYTVRLRVRDNCNEDNDSLKLVVHGNDSLDFRWQEGPLCTDREIALEFVQRGEQPFGDFRWEFPDGIKRKGSEVTYTFADQGKMWVKLSAIADGCESVISHSLQLNRSPEALASIVQDTDIPCSPLKVSFYGANNNEEACTALWDFKDNSFSELLTVEDKIFEEAGDYEVSFLLTTEAGCVDSAVIPVKVLFTPEVAMELKQELFCTKDGNFSVVVVNKTENAGDCAFEWWKDNERISLLPDSVELSYNNFFDKSEVVLKATHKESHCSISIMDSIISAHQVVAKLTVEPQHICAGSTVKFTNASEYAGGEMKLSLGDGTSLVTDDSFEHIYDEAAVYQVNLQVTNPEGCADSLEIPVNVYALPVAAFTWSRDNSIGHLPQVEGQTEKDNGGIKFLNESYFDPLDIESAGLKYYWNFGDQTAESREKDPAHVFPNNGVYEVWLYVESMQGCRDSISDVVDIATVKGLYVPNAFAPAVADEGISRFQPKGVGLDYYSIKVYGKDGTCVWSSSELKDGRPAAFWDGTFKGMPLPKGVYNYELNATFIDGTVWEGRNGSVILIR